MEAIKAMAHLVYIVRCFPVFSLLKPVIFQFAPSCTGFQPQVSVQSHPKMKHPSVKHGPNVETPKKNPWFRAKGVFNTNGEIFF